MTAKPTATPPIPERRQLRPRPPVAVAPLAISTENCLATVGLTPRKLRELLAAHPDVPRVRVGHTTLVEVGAFYGLLARLALKDEEPGDEPPGDAVDEQPQTPDEVLRRLGRERVEPGSPD